MIDAVRPVELQGDDRAAEEVEEDSVVGAAADAGVDDVGVADGLAVVLFLALSRSGFQPGIVKASACGFGMELLVSTSMGASEPEAPP